MFQAASAQADLSFRYLVTPTVIPLADVPSSLLLGFRLRNNRILQLVHIANRRLVSIRKARQQFLLLIVDLDRSSKDLPLLACVEATKHLDGYLTRRFVEVEPGECD